jgi:hypothetical protein
METEMELKKRLEKEGEEKVKNMVINGVPVENVRNACLQIISDGANEFEKKTGRKMTYSEMRGMYG